MDWFLYHNGLRLERVKIMCGGIQKMKIKLMIKKLWSVAPENINIYLEWH